MKIKSSLTLFVLFGFFYFINPIALYADTSCQPIYGGGQTCVSTGNILVDKKILNPKTNIMVDNLSTNDATFEPETLVTFQINVTNKGDASIKKTDIKDVFPQHVVFSSGTGKFDANTKNLTFTIVDLKPQETRTFTVVGKVVNADQISTGQGVICVINQVTAVDSSNKSTSQDNTQLCIEKKSEVKGGFPVLTPTEITSTPSTGAESLALFSLLPTGIAGWMLRKYTHKKIKMRGGE